MTYLVDVNVWFALAVIGHRQHAAAKAWFEDSTTDRILFCRTTQQALLRLLTNVTLMGANVLTPAEAWRIYDALRTDHRVGFADEPPQVEEHWRLATRARKLGTNFW